MVLKRPLASGVTGLPSRPTVAAFLTHWLAHVAWARLRYSTARTYAGVVARVIVPALGAVRLRALASTDIERAQLAWQRAGVKASTFTHAALSLRERGPRARRARRASKVAETWQKRERPRKSLSGAAANL